MATKTTNNEPLDKYLRGTLSYYYNPFSRTEVSPKIPDGKMETSIGVQQVKSDEYVAISTLPEANLLNGYITHYVFLMPSIASPLQIWDTMKPAGPEPTDPANPTIKHIIPNTDFFEWNATTKTIVRDKTPVTWRMVSQGLQIWPITSTTATSGSFESFSIPIPTSEMLADGIPVTIGLDVTSPRLTPALIAYYENNIARLRDSKTYISGTINQLRDIQFRQLPNDPEHSPINIAVSYETTGPFDTSSKVNFLEDVIDHSFHMRVIRLRIPNNSRFIINTCTNFEFQYRLSSPVAGFQTYNDRHINMAVHADGASRNDGGNAHGTQQRRIVTPRLTGAKRDGSPNDTQGNTAQKKLTMGV